MIEKYLVLFLYFGILFLIGLWASRGIQGLSDYYVGGKKLGYWVVAFSARATGESGWLLLGLTGMGALIGVQAFWVVVGEVLGVSLAWFFMAERFKEATDQFQSLTVPDYLASRFHTQTHTLRIIAAFCLSAFVVMYVSAQIDITGSTFESFLGWDYYTGALVGFSIVVAYTFSGGFLAVAWSDLFQGIVMFFALVALPVVGLFAMEAPQQLFAQLTAIDPALGSIWGKEGLSLLGICSLIGFLGIGLGFLGSPQVFVRFISIKDRQEIRRGRWVAIGFTLLTDSAAVLIGIIGRVWFSEPGQAVESVLGQGAEQVLPMMVEALLPVLIAGIYIAAILSAVMSTIDSLLVVASSAILHDFYQKVLKQALTISAQKRLSRIITLGFALLALGIAFGVAYWVPGRTIFWFPIFGWSGIAATFCPMIILALFWPRFNESGAIAAMITGFLAIPLVKFGLTQLPRWGAYFEAMAEMTPAFVLSLLAGIIMTFLSTRTVKKNI